MDAVQSGEKSSILTPGFASKRLALARVNLVVLDFSNGFLIGLRLFKHILD